MLVKTLLIIITLYLLFPTIHANPLNNVALQCCGSNASQCCLSHLIANEPLFGCGEPTEVSDMTVCVEELLWNESIFSYRLDECCQYLYPSECSSSCRQYLQTPTRSVASKLSFTVNCPLPDQIPLDDNCVASIKRKLHKCFGVCINRRGVHLPYEPHAHCPAVSDPEELDPCIGDEI
ncbi:unnamed protein product [Anisakis simplex]|uniref:Domain of unknown function DB domain-containing protein n=1 Tax=Anisakis simplex TaxID=6269 RepID=A0A0M3KC74_ANISI|nr:unnamed protein product [Anisakis simplex]